MDSVTRRLEPPIVLEPTCPTRRVLDLVAEKWKLSVICVLAAGTSRYSELQRALPGVTPKMLTQTLRSLERDGILTRLVYPIVPPHVEYNLTPLGKSLYAALGNLLDWGRQHLPEVEAMRVQTDAQTLNT